MGVSSTSRWVAGINAVASALEHDAEHVREVLIEAGAKNPRLSEIENEALDLGIAVRKVNNQALEGMSGGVRHQGVVARYEAAETLDEDALPGLIEAANGKALILILDSITDPHNLGACLRSAAAANATAVIIPKDKAVSVTATVRKTSAGAADRIALVRVTNLARAMRKVQELGVWLYGMDGEAKAEIYDIDLKGNIGLVLGSEGEGMRRLTRETCDGLAKLPMPGDMESLNVSVATGIALFEVVRQRRGSK